MPVFFIMIYYLKLHRAFFDHSKIDLLIEKHGIQGAYCILFIWSEMLLREGSFDSNNEYDIVAVARRVRITADEVHAIIHTAVKTNLLTITKKGVFRKDRIDDTLVELESYSKRGQKGGIASGKSRTKAKQDQNSSSTQVQAELNKIDLASTKTNNYTILHYTNESTSTEGSRSTTSESSNGASNSAALRPLWGRLASKLGLSSEDDGFLEWGQAQFEIIDNHPLREEIEANCMLILKDGLMRDELPQSLQDAIELTEQQSAT